MEWRKMNSEDISNIKKKYIPKEIAFVFMTLAFDIVLISLMIYGFIHLFDFITIICNAFILFIVYIVSKALFKSIKSLISFFTNDVSVIECVLDEVSVNRIGLINNSNITLMTEKGTTYRTSYSSAFVTKAVKGMPAILVDFGRNGKGFELVLR